MKVYRVERMTNRDFDNYMSGSNCYNVEHLHIRANDREEAINKAQEKGYVVNENWVIESDEAKAKETIKAVKKEIKDIEKEIEELKKAVKEKEKLLKKLLDK